jgi:hypothetical protein
MKRIDFSGIKESFKEEGYQLLTGNYLNNRQRLEFMCPNGHKHFITWDKWQQGQRCGICSGTKQHERQFINDSFAKEGYVLLTFEYKNAHQKLEFVCPDGHRHFITWDKWKSGHRCGICNLKVVTYQEVKDSFEKRGYQLLTQEYKNNVQRLDFVCPCGHKYYITWASWTRGSGCAVCAGSTVLKIEDIKQHFYHRGHELLAENYVNAHQKLECVCSKGHKYSITWANFQQGHGCPYCTSNVSKPEIEIFEFLNCRIQCEKKDRIIIDPYELDIVVPSKETAIEYGGLYWHSEANGKNKDYHINKLERCQKKGYNLITIFGDEYLNRKDVVLHRLLHILGIDSSLSIYAKDCEIKEIDNKMSSDFLDVYHTQGDANSKIRLGAFYKDKLVSVMTFSKLSIAKGSKAEKGVWELNRFCSHIDYKVVGIASKLLSYFTKNYSWNRIISYADRRWSNGDLYYKLGFQLLRKSSPNYWYFTSDKKRIHRFALRKKQNEPKDKTEWQLRQEEGYNRIWDCGNLVFIKEKIG